jgi:predicted SAM-dependent methyltransferase
MRMNLGCGPVQPEGWVNVDVQPLGQDHVADVRSTGWWQTWSPDTFEIVVMNHSLQQFTVQEIPDLLSNVWRVLRPNGAVHIIVPDVIRAFEAYQRNDELWFPNHDNHDGCSLMLAQYLTWYSSARTLFTRRFLLTLLTDARFIPRQPLMGDCELDDRFGESIYADGIKP